MPTTYDTDWLVRAMADANVRTGVLAARSGISRSQIQRIRNGMPPRFDTYQKLCAALDAKPARRKQMQA